MSRPISAEAAILAALRALLTRAFGMSEQFGQIRICRFDRAWCVEVSRDDKPPIVMVSGPTLEGCVETCARRMGATAEAETASDRPAPAPKPRRPKGAGKT